MPRYNFTDTVYPFVSGDAIPGWRESIFPIGDKVLENIFPADDKVLKKLSEVLLKLDALDAKIDRIFGKSILLNGRFTDLKI